jgi:O-glycosyl hydrolase
MNRLLAPAVLASIVSSASAVDITVDGSKRHQSILGFGTCLISWDDRMAEWYRRPEAARIFGEELRFNIIRANLCGQGTIGPTDDPNSISHTDPAFAATDTRTPVFIDFYHAVKAVNGEVLMIGTVWSPPAWMKLNNETVDDASGAIMGLDYTGEKAGTRVEFTNRVRPELYPHFAAWLVEMVRYYQRKGVEMYAISPANEPQFTQTFESCVWTPADLATITGLVGERLDELGLGHVQLFGHETLTSFNWDNGPNVNYTRAMRDNPLAWKHFDAWATHGYSDGVKGESEANSSAQFWNLIKDDGKPFWVTEGGTGGHDWPEPVKPGGVALAIHNSLVAGNASAFVPWQFAEDARTEHNLMPLEGLNKKTHAVRHFSRFIPRGATRVEATPAFGAINASAFVNGQDYTIVLVNPTDELQPVTINLRNMERNPFVFAVVTDASRDSADGGRIPVTGNMIRVDVPGPGIVTLTTME